jgi:hypothetical protein
MPLLSRTATMAAFTTVVSEGKGRPARIRKRPRARDTQGPRRQRPEQRDAQGQKSGVVFPQIPEGQDQFVPQRGDSPKALHVQGLGGYQPFVALNQPIAALGKMAFGIVKTLP